MSLPWAVWLFVEWKSFRGQSGDSSLTAGCYNYRNELSRLRQLLSFSHHSRVSIPTTTHIFKVNWIPINSITAFSNHPSTTLTTTTTTTTTKMPNYIVTEPSPSTTSFVRSGRGGAGNISRVSNKTHTKSTSHSATATAPSRRFFSGIGGAGNVHAASERPALSLDEEFDRAQAREKTNTGHCGIGGAGNVFHRKGSDARSDVSSSSSLSSKSKLWSRVSGTFNRD
ncbi:Fc.00g097290.m01.CDS01 [Cosmosporella sp. VM-42]